RTDPVVRDHRTDPVVRDHRTQSGLSAGHRYNEVQQISSHNSYDDNGPKDNIETQLAMGVRSFELDLHNSDQRANWDVYHVTPIFSGGDYIDNLRGGLAKFKKYHDEHPNHEVITIWLELKDDWKAGGHEPRDLDARLDEELPGLIYRPAAILASAPGASNLREAVRRAGWPTLEALRGQFRFVMIGNCKPGARYLYDVLGYQGSVADGHEGYRGNRNVFAAPEDDLRGKLNLKPGDNWLNSIFFNTHNTDGIATPLAIVRSGFVARIWRI